MTRGRARRLRSRFLPARDGQQDDGFVLLESIISISLITVIMAALAMLFISVIHTNNQQRARQAAVQVADTSAGTLRSLQPSDLVPGRTATAVAAQWAAAPSGVQPWLASMQQASDTSVATPILPTAPTTQVINNITYTVNTYLGWCWLDTSNSNGCTATSTSTSVKYLRAVIAVTWPDSKCSSGTTTANAPACLYVTSTLVSTAADPVFNLNEAPPAVPIIVNPGSQTTFAVGDTVNLQMAVQSGTGVPTFTWLVSAGALPAGLAMNAAGLISGKITGSSGTVSTTVQVTDGYARNANSPATFSWTVLPALTIANPGAQASISGTAISPVTVTASGGSGAPYTWSDPGSTLPPGLTVANVSNQARITGTPTTPGSYSVTLLVKDSTNTRQATTTFVWTVAYPPLALSGQSAQTDTLNQVSPGLTMSASGGDGNYTYTDSSTLPAGLSINRNTGVISGTSTALGSNTVTITVTDGQGTSKSTSFNWAVVARPTISTPNPGTNSITSKVSLAVPNTCANSPCSYSISGQPTGLTIDSTGTIVGTVGGSPKTYTGIKVTVTDADGATATTSGFNWVVVAAPTVTSPSAQVDTTGATITPLQLVTSCPDPACTYVLNNGPGGLAVDSNGLITGKITSTAGTRVSATVTVTDSDGATATTAAFTWTITAPPTVTSPGAQVDTTAATISLQLTTTCPDPTCSYTLNNGPAGLKIDGNGLITGKITTAAGANLSASVTVTDSDRVSATSAAFTWSITAPPTVTSPGNLSSRVGSAVGVALTTGCPNSPCSYALNNGPAGVTIDSGGNLNGPVTGSTGTYANVTIVATDADGISSAATAKFSWIVGAASSIAGTWPVATTSSGVPEQDFAYTCTNTGKKTCTISVSGLPSGIGLSAASGASAANSVTTLTVNQGSGTVYLNGKVASNATKGSYSVGISINGTSPGSDSGTWTVS